MPSPKKILADFWICLSAAYVALLPQFYLVFDSGNRYTMLWSTAYHMAILCAIAVIAVLFFAAQALLRNAGRKLGLARWTDALCLLWLIFLCLRTVSALLVEYDQLPGLLLALLWSPWVKLVLYVLLPVPLILFYAGALKRGLKRWYLTLSILWVLFVVQSFSWVRYETYEAKLDAGAVAKKTADGRNILVFIMDEWSFSRTFGGPDWMEKYPELSNLVSESTLYAKAYSRGAGTKTSIPRFLFSNDEPFSQKSYPEVLSFMEEGVPHQGKSIYGTVPDSWLKVAVGFYIDYPVILSGSVDHVLKFESENARRGFGGEFRHLILSQFAFLRIIGVRFPYVINPEWFPQMEIHQHAMEVVRSNPADILGVFHYAWPHYPYIWNRQGRKPGPIDADAAKFQTVRNYEDNLDYLDVVVGEICDTLKKSGKWEDSLIIFTSDHTWRFDPETPGGGPQLDGAALDAQMELADGDPTSEWKHVPLIIKYPGQKTGRVEEAKVVGHGELYRLFEAYVQGEDYAELPRRLETD